MKKTLSILSAAILTVSCLPVSAATATYIPVGFYMKAEESTKYTLEDDGKIINIIPTDLTEDITVTANIYFEDLHKGAWSVSPKWNSNSEFIKITDVHNPLEEGNLKEFAYAAKDENGNLTNLNCAYDFSTNTKYGSKNFTVRSSDGKALVPYGEASDSYPLLSFDFTISKDTPEGVYEIFFTKDEDNCTRCAMDAVNKNEIFKFPNNSPRITNLTIKILSDKETTANLGDINIDGTVDSSDASLALAEYAAIATGSETTLNSQQKLNGDVNFDKIIDSSDASKILAYYAMIATGQEPSWD